MAPSRRNSIKVPEWEQNTGRCCRPACLEQSMCVANMLVPFGDAIPDENTGSVFSENQQQDIWQRDHDDQT